MWASWLKSENTAGDRRVIVYAIDSILLRFWRSQSLHWRSTQRIQWLRWKRRRVVRIVCLLEFHDLERQVAGAVPASVAWPSRLDDCSLTTRHVVAERDSHELHFLSQSGSFIAALQRFHHQIFSVARWTLVYPKSLLWLICSTSSKFSREASNWDVLCGVADAAYATASGPHREAARSRASSSGEGAATSI